MININRRRIPVLALAALLFAATPLRAGEEPPNAGAAPVVVITAEGAVERVDAGGEAALLELGERLDAGARVEVGNGSVVAVVATSGPSAGRVVRLRGPFSGTAAELVARAPGDGPVLPPEAIDALRAEAPAVLDGPGITRGASKGPLRPVYPAGSVSVPCGPFVFVSGVADLEGATLEVRLFDKDPTRGGKPVHRFPATASPAVPPPGLGLDARKTYWWQVAALLDGGEEAMAGEVVEFTPVPSPVTLGFPPDGFESGEARASWHIARARAYVARKLYLDAVRELAILTEAGGGSSVIDQQRDGLAKKLGLDADDLSAVAASVVTATGRDVLRLADGREIPGKLVREEPGAIVFAMEGSVYRVDRADISGVTRGASGPLVSAAPWVTATTRRYIVSTNAGKEFAEEAGRRLELLFTAFARDFGKELGARNARNLKVRIFRDYEDYRAYLVKDHAETIERAQGFYDPNDSTLYLYRHTEAGVERTWNVLMHEGTHQVLHIVCNQDPDVTGLPHFWIVEALPCWMETYTGDGKELAQGAPDPKRVGNFKSLRDEGKLDALGAFLARRQAEFRSTDQYDQGYALLWFLMESDGGKLRAPLLRYSKYLLQNRSREDAEEKFFGAPLARVAAGYETWFSQRESTTLATR